MDFVIEMIIPCNICLSVPLPGMYTNMHPTDIIPTLYFNIYKCSVWCMFTF